MLKAFFRGSYPFEKGKHREFTGIVLSRAVSKMVLVVKTTKEAFQKGRVVLKSLRKALKKALNKP